MKLTQIFFSLALVLISLHLSSSTACAQSQSISGSTFYGGNAYSYKISDEDLANTPSWNPAKEDPPLSLRKAVEIARANLRRFVKKADGLDVEKIELTQMGVEKWLYEVSFHCWKDECEDEAGGNFRIHIRLDGSVIEPEVTPDAEQRKTKATAKPNNSFNPSPR
jgi:hypothetical protein